MGWLLDFFVIWLSMDILIIATAWYASTVIPPRWPDWWQRVVVDIDPDYRIRRSRLH